MKTILIAGKQLPTQQPLSGASPGSLLRADHSSHRDDLLDHLKFLAGVGLTLWAPTLAFCVALAELWPLYMMACNHALGLALGLVMFKRPPADQLWIIPRPAPIVFIGARSGLAPTVSLLLPLQ